MDEGEEVWGRPGDVGVARAEEADGFGMMEAGGPTGWSERAAQAASGGGRSPADVELARRSQAVPRVPAPVAGQGCRGGRGVDAALRAMVGVGVGASRGAEGGEQV